MITYNIAFVIRLPDPPLLVDALSVSTDPIRRSRRQLGDERILLLLLLLLLPWAAAPRQVRGKYPDAQA